MPDSALLPSASAPSAGLLISMAGSIPESPFTSSSSLSSLLRFLCGAVTLLPLLLCIASSKAFIDCAGGTSFSERACSTTHVLAR